MVLNFPPIINCSECKNFFEKQEEKEKVDWSLQDKIRLFPLLRLGNKNRKVLIRIMDHVKKLSMHLVCVSFVCSTNK